MDFTKALTFSFDDEDWITKYVIGSLMMLVGMIIFVIPAGYQVRVARNVIRQKPNPLPSGSELGEVVADGLMATIAILIYALPVIIMACMLGFMGGILGDSDLGGILFSCFACCLSVFMIIFGLAAAAFYWVGVIRYAETGNFSEFLKFGSLWEDIRGNMGTLLGLLLFTFIFGLIMAVIWPFSIITCVGPIVLMFYQQVVTGHLIGQAGLDMIGGSKFKRGI